MSRDPKVRRDRTTRLSAAAIAAMVIAYLLAFAALAYLYMTTRLEAPTAPTDSHLPLIRATAAISILTAFSACAAAAASRRKTIIIAIILATVPFAMLPIAIIGIAFGPR